MMGAGYWLNYKDGHLVQVDSHDMWISNRENAHSIGINEWIYDKITNSSDIDEIRLLALYNGLVRIREYPRYTSIQFVCDLHRNQHVLKAISETLSDLKIHPDTIICMENFSTGQSLETSVGTFQDELTSDKFDFPVMYNMHPFLANLEEEQCQQQKK